jgi:hypothetical protein
MRFSKIKISFYFFFLISCAVAKDKDMYYEKIITLPSKKLIELKEIGIKFELKECGRQSMFENGHQVGEQPYCLIHIQTEKDTLDLTNKKKDIFVKKYFIQLQDINPWGSEQRGLPGYSVKIKIATAPSVVFVENFGWTVDHIISEDSLSIPTSFEGIPFYHYRSASEGVGSGLDSLAGQTVRFQKLALKEGGQNKDEKIYAYVVIDKYKAYTGWIAFSEKAPGIGSLKRK